jgi:hypothetical protein
LLHEGREASLTENARTIEQTTTCIGKLLDQVTAKASASYFREAGYAT